MVSSTALKIATTNSMDAFSIFSSLGKVERKISTSPNTRSRVWLSKLWVVFFRISAAALKALAVS
jgi:hypothetical protein